MDATPVGAAAAIKEVERLAKAAAGPQTLTLQVPDGTGGMKPVPVLIHDGRVVSLDQTIQEASVLASDLRAKEKEPPGWREGTAEHQSLSSFIEHVLRFKAPASVVWASPSERSLVSVLDYHPAGADSPAAWGRHRGTYACPLSDAWTAWGGEKGLSLSQEGFAELLDSRDYELSAGKFPGTEKDAPTPASLVTLANNLEVYSTATARRERDPKTGRVQVSYSEDKGVSGTVMPPPAFAISIRVFQDSARQILEVRLRVAVEEGRARFNLNIHGASDVLREAFESVCELVATETSVPVFSGTPETER